MGLSPGWIPGKDLRSPASPEMHACMGVKGELIGAPASPTRSQNGRAKRVEPPWEEPPYVRNDSIWAGQEFLHEQAILVGDPKGS